MHDGLEGIVAVRSYLVGISVALARAILPVAKKVRCLQEFYNLRGYRLAGNKFGQVVTSDLFDYEAIEWFGRYFSHVEKSDFLTGRNGKFSSCDLGWLVKADNFAKVLQGNYDNRVAA